MFISQYNPHEHLDIYPSIAPTYSGLFGCVPVQELWSTAELWFAGCFGLWIVCQKGSSWRDWRGENQMELCGGCICQCFCAQLCICLTLRALLLSLTHFGHKHSLTCNESHFVSSLQHEGSGCLCKLHTWSKYCWVSPIMFFTHQRETTVWTTKILLWLLSPYTLRLSCWCRSHLSHTWYLIFQTAYIFLMELWCKLCPLIRTAIVVFHFAYRHLTNYLKEMDALMSWTNTFHTKPPSYHALDISAN